MFKSVSLRLYPTKLQEVILAKNFGCVRWIYNWGLSLKKFAWDDCKVDITGGDLSKALPWLKKNGYEWLTEACSTTLQQSLGNLDRAYKNFFKGQTKFPKFKKRSNRQSFRTVGHCKISRTHVRLSKLGWFRYRNDQDTLPTNIKFITVVKTCSGKYFAQVTFEDGVEIPSKPPITRDTTIGIDLGLRKFATLSSGEQIANPKHLKKNLIKLKHLQRLLSRKQNGSKNRNKARIKVAKHHEYISNCRKDFLHKVTHKLVNDNQVHSICIEDLAVKNMIKNHNLAQSISDVSWSAFRSILAYKCEWYGKNLIVINRFDPSSKMCSCGVKNTQLGSEEFWICPSCNQTHDRDVLAANNIKEFGLLKVRATEGSSGSNASGDERLLSSSKEESNVA